MTYLGIVVQGQFTAFLVTVTLSLVLIVQSYKVDFINKTFKKVANLSEYIMNDFQALTTIGVAFSHFQNNPTKSTSKHFLKFSQELIQSFLKIETNHFRYIIHILQVLTNISSVITSLQLHTYLITRDKLGIRMIVCSLCCYQQL